MGAPWRFLTHAGRTLHLTAWAREYGIDPVTLRHRLKRMSLAEALALGPGNGRGRKGLQEYNGRAQTIAAWAREYGLRPALVQGRMARGIPLGVALRMTSRTEPRYVLLDGQRLRLSEACARTGIGYFTALRRIQKGMDPARAVRAPVGTAPPIRITVWGKTRTIARWARSLRVRKLGLKAATIATRLRRGMAPVAALSTPLAHRGDAVTIEGVTRRAFEWARIAGLPANTIRSRIYRGVTGAALLAPAGQLPQRLGDNHARP
jgi:hypothetical protein